MNEEIAPPARRQPVIKAAPKVRQIYWCDFWQEALAPEFWKRRPILVLSFKNALNGHILALPVTTISHEPTHAWAHQLAFDWNPSAPLNRWVICNHIYTASTARLLPIQKGVIPRVPEGEFNAILQKVYSYLPQLPPLPPEA